MYEFSSAGSMAMRMPSTLLRSSRPSLRALPSCDIVSDERFCRHVHTQQNVSTAQRVRVYHTHLSIRAVRRERAISYRDHASAQARHASHITYNVRAASSENRRRVSASTYTALTNAGGVITAIPPRRAAACGDGSSTSAGTSVVTSMLAPSRQCLSSS
jgi:hypothetical protein